MVKLRLKKGNYCFVYKINNFTFVLVLCSKLFNT